MTERPRIKVGGPDAWLRATVDTVAQVVTDQAGNPVLQLVVTLEPGCNVGGGYRPHTGETFANFLQEPFLVRVEVDAHGLASLAWRAAKAKGRKARHGPLTAKARGSFMYRTEVKR